MQAGFTPAVTYAHAPQAWYVRQPFQTIRSRGRWAGPRDGRIADGSGV